MSAISILPTDEQEQRAKWDLLYSTSSCAPNSCAAAQIVRLAGQVSV
jgi:hypothetical protein